MPQNQENNQLQQPTLAIPNTTGQVNRIFDSEQDRAAFDAEVELERVRIIESKAKKDQERKNTPTRAIDYWAGLSDHVGLEEVKTCDQHGDYKSTVLATLSRTRIFSSCPECVEIKRQRDIEELDAKNLMERNEKIQRLIGSSGIPKFFAKKTFDTFISKTDKQESIKLKFAEFAANVGKEDFGSFLIAYGATGAGKTHLSVASAISAVSKNNTVLYMLASDVIRSLRDSWGKDAVKKESEVLRQFAMVDLLVIDEIGVQFGTDSEQNHLFEVINNRILEVKPTILITNLLLSSKDSGVKTFRNYLGERTFDRMKEVGESICFDWDSHRGAKE